jgi:hypothetical protein
MFTSYQVVGKGPVDLVTFKQCRKKQPVPSPTSREMLHATISTARAASRLAIEVRDDKGTVMHLTFTFETKEACQLRRPYHNEKLPPKPKNWTNSEKLELARLAREGIDAREIAYIVGVAKLLRRR